jgi:hypothetical protein
MIFFWFIIPFLVLMVLSGTRRHQREEENEESNEGGFQDEGGFEKDEESNEGGKASLTPLWKFVQNLMWGEEVEPPNFYVLMIVMKENIMPVHIPM